MNIFTIIGLSLQFSQQKHLNFGLVLQHGSNKIGWKKNKNTSSEIQIWGSQLASKNYIFLGLIWNQTTIQFTWKHLLRIINNHMDMILPLLTNHLPLWIILMYQTWTKMVNSNNLPTFYHPRGFWFTPNWLSNYKINFCQQSY